MTVAEKLEFLLKKQKKTQADLAKYLNIDVSTISAWKKRNSISKRHINKVAQFLGVDVNYLLTDLTDTPNTQSIIANAPIIHNSPNSHISINDAINSLPPEVGAVVKYMMELNEKERLEFMQCVFKNCSKEER